MNFVYANRFLKEAGSATIKYKLEDSISEADDDVLDFNRAEFNDSEEGGPLRLPKEGKHNQ